MATPPPLFLAVLAPTRDEAEALRPAEAYLKRAGTRVASRLLGCPEPNHETAIDAEFSDSLLRTAALCAGLRGLTDAPAQRRRL